jgi:homoserine kinase
VSAPGPFTVEVPCSTSNLGAGFDAIGIALGRARLVVHVRPGPAGKGIRLVRFSGEGEGAVALDGTNRILTALSAAARLAGRDPETLSAALEADNTIPLKRGLGSSAAAAVAGALVLEGLLRDGPNAPIDLQRALAAALSLEGHPDNVAPCLLGGAQVVVLDERGRARACAVRPGAPLRAALLIPDVELATSEARAVLPRKVTLADAVFNLGRAALFAAALASGELDLLGLAMEDRLHQPPRSRLLPWLPAMLSAARSAGARGATLSGAGTTVFALCRPAEAEDVAQALLGAARAHGLPARALTADLAVEGARIRGDRTAATSPPSPAAP